MQTLTRFQKTILVILGILDILVIGGMAIVVFTTMRTPASTLPVSPTATPVPTREVKAKWTVTPSPTLRATIPPQPSRTATPTMTPFPTITPSPVPPTATPTPVPPIVLNNGGFDMLMPNRIPGWTWDAYVNYKQGDATNSESSYAEPFFMAADDPGRQIEGSTLKIETIRWLKYRAWVHQTITITAGIDVFFQVQTNAFSSLDRVIVKAGIDPTGAGNCYDALWGVEQRINQDDGIMTLTSPVVRIAPAETDPVTPTAELDHGEEEPPATEEYKVQYGRVTVCIYAEPSYPHINNAAFFDEAEIVIP